MPSVPRPHPTPNNVYGSRPATPITLTRVIAVLAEKPGPDCTEDDIVQELKDAARTFVDSGDRFKRASAVLRDAGCHNVVAADLTARPQAAARRAGDKALLVEALTELLAESPHVAAAPPLAPDMLAALQNQVKTLTHQLDAARLVGPALAVDPVARAEQLLANRNFSGAELVIRNGLQLDPHHITLHQLLGKTLNRLNRAAEAEAYLTTALRLDAAHVESRVEMGKVQYYLGRDNEAQQHLRIALEACPENAEALTMLGMALLDWSGTSHERGRIGTDAERLYRDMLKGNPDNGQALFGMGRAFMVQGRGKRVEAERFLRVALARDTDNPSIKAALAMCTARQAEAEQLMEQAIQAAPNVPRFLCAMGLLLDKTARNPRSEAFLRRAYEAQNDAVKFNYALGEFYHRRFDATHGVQYIEAAAQLDNTNARVQLELAACQRDLGRPAQSEQMLGAVLARIPHHPVALEMMATLLVKQNRNIEAEPYLRSIVSKNASDHNRLRLAACLVALERPDEAEELLHRDVDPACATRRDALLAQSCKLRGRMADALTYYRALASAESDKAEHHREAGYALLQLGRFAEAEHFLLTAVRLQPDVGSARWMSNREILAQLFWCQGSIERAERAYRNEMQRGGQNAAGFAWFADKLMGAHRYGQAETYAAAAMRIDALNDDYKLLLGRSLHQQGRPHEALEHLMDCVTLHPTNGRYHEELGHCWSTLGNAVQSERAYRNAINHGNDTAATREGLARARMSLRATHPH